MMRDLPEDRKDALHLVKVGRVWRTGHKIEFRRNHGVGHQKRPSTLTRPEIGGSNLVSV